MLREACCSRVLPTPVDPVKLIFRSRWSFITACDTTAEVLVWMRLTTPAGNPASSKVLTKYAAVSGVSFADLSTMVQPAASAAPPLRAFISIGKFHGVINNAGPTGCEVVSTRNPPLVATEYEPCRCAICSAYQRKKPIERANSPADSRRGFPLSRVIRSAKSSALDCSSACAR